MLTRDLEATQIERFQLVELADGFRNFACI